MTTMNNQDKDEVQKMIEAEIGSLDERVHAIMEETLGDLVTIREYNEDNILNK